MKKSRLWRVIWIIALYGLLIAILYLVILYKVKWQDKDLNTYLYFYACDNNLCTSSTKPKEYYNKIVCENNICPYVEDINDNLVILNNSSKSWIYDYANNKIINNKYKEYKHINKNYYVFKDYNNKYGIMESQGKIILDPTYDDILDFKDNCLITREEDQFKIRSIENKDEVLLNINAEFSNFKLINSKYYLYQYDNKYYINTINGDNKINDSTYDYLLSIDNIVLAVSDKLIDILNNDLESTLIMKIPTYYEYKIVEERETLEPYIKDDILYFKVVLEDNKFITYKYDLQKQRII